MKKECKMKYCKYNEKGMCKVSNNQQILKDCLYENYEYGYKLQEEIIRRLEKSNWEMSEEIVKVKKLVVDRIIQIEDE